MTPKEFARKVFAGQWPFWLVGVIFLAAFVLVVAGYWRRGALVMGIGVAVAAGLQPRLTLSPFVPIETMTAYIVQVSQGDAPAGTLEYRTIFAVGMLLFVMTFALNLASSWLRRRFREEYA